MICFEVILLFRFMLISVFRCELAEIRDVFFFFWGGGGIFLPSKTRGTAVAQWLGCCATNRKVAGSIPAGVSGFFIDIKSFWSHYGPGADSASNRNEYQEYFL